MLLSIKLNLSIIQRSLIRSNHNLKEVICPILNKHIKSCKARRWGPCLAQGIQSEELLVIPMIIIHFVISQYDSVISISTYE